MVNSFEKLTKIRNEKNYSYEDMATKLKISKCFYWQLEHKKRRLYYDMAKRIAEVFNLKPDDIFYEKEK